VARIERWGAPSSSSGFGRRQQGPYTPAARTAILAGMSRSALDAAYTKAGVDYDRLDAFKRACQRAAATTVPALAALGLREVEGARGDSAYLIETDDAYLAHVEEGLGTKNLVADAVQAATGKCFYRAVGIDTVATIVNDLITCGALPVSVAMHAAVGDGAWFDDETRASELAEGFAEGCRQSGAVWGGGETPALKGIVEPQTIVLAGSAFGRIKPKSLRIAGDVRAGDAIVFVASSGVQTNGLTLCRKIAGELPQGYLTPVPGDPRSYGEALLAPSVVYAKLIAACQAEGIKPHYAVHVTGHGWRKLMRLAEPFVYVIDQPGEAPPLFRFLADKAGLSPEQAYATFNMGVGFALYMDPRDAQRVLALAARDSYAAWVAGRVEKQAGRKAVEVPGLSLQYEADTLAVR
jgi:phosphoribosylformylglycinamidine cyclo-ligase